MVDALAESEALLQELIKHTPVGIFVLTGENFSYVNPTGCEILGPPPQISFSAHPLLTGCMKNRVSDGLNS